MEEQQLYSLILCFAMAFQFGVSRQKIAFNPRVKWISSSNFCCVDPISIKVFIFSLSLTHAFGSGFLT